MFFTLFCATFPYCMAALCSLTSLRALAMGFEGLDWAVFLLTLPVFLSFFCSGLADVGTFLKYLVIFSSLFLLKSEAPET